MGAENKIDQNQQAYFPFIASSLWISTRLELLGGLIILAAAIFAVTSRETISPGKRIGLPRRYYWFTELCKWLKLMFSISNCGAVYILLAANHSNAEFFGATNEWIGNQYSFRWKNEGIDWDCTGQLLSWCPFPFYALVHRWAYDCDILIWSAIGSTMGHGETTSKRMASKWWSRFPKIWNQVSWRIGFGVERNKLFL